jgi:hypothetical protein
MLAIAAVLIALLYVKGRSRKAAPAPGSEIGTQA